MKKNGFFGDHKKKPIILPPDFKAYTHSWMTALATPWFYLNFIKNQKNAGKKLEDQLKKNGMIFLKDLDAGNVSFLLLILLIL